ncbi:hypothetical protein [Pseudobacteriovorax antillogorgiicola]|uniref:Uncharacterized protein n=1 Tax=Pseudobacteriovorax antillogorgiicola TaxID=1513793 RepID=A0A1Y6CTF0_9BACT|nr:hypothetical protein [Pseudobacteriovorax antillogorgiicola]TCS44993.1 hypothetical protein EDD56_13030 [Pseudobacteriovorax antillogorgiicola]SMF76599.1 hypothetical protein SAMN06296036_13044 [Pseudobacteriovorax antillogorgiicola]
MKIAMMALGLSVSTLGFAKALPEAPADCLDSIQLKGFCSDFSAPPLVGSVKIKFFVAAEKSDFPTVDSATSRYLDFVAWPGYALASGTDNLEFNQSAVLAPIPAQGDQAEILRHYADYRIAAPIVGWQNVRVLTHNTVVKTYDGALASLEFVVQNQGPQEVPAGAAELDGSEGVKDQIGSVHVVDCSTSELCTSNQHLLIYESTVTPDINILPTIAGKAIQDGIEGIMIGMFLNVDNGDGDIL